MTEWEKMVAGLPCNDADDEMAKRRLVAKKLFREYNRTTDDELDERQKIFARLFRSFGKNLYIEPDFICELGSNISFGDNVFINFGCIIFDCGEVNIGSNVFFGPRAGLYTTNHALDSAERSKNICVSKPINIGDRVWFGASVTVLPGVTIGSDTVIGAGSVVTHDIPSGVVAVGNPCRVLRKITEEDKLL